MTDDDPRAALYAQYEAALDVLVGVPARFTAEALAVNQQLDADTAAAASSAEADTDRLTQTVAS